MGFLGQQVRFGSHFLCVADYGQRWDGWRKLWLPAANDRPQSADLRAYPLRGEHEVACCQARQNPVVPHSSQRHGGYAATLRTIRRASELTGPNARFQVGGKG